MVDYATEGLRRWSAEQDKKRGWVRGIVSKIVDLALEFDGESRFREMVEAWDADCRAKIEKGESPTLLFNADHDTPPLELPEIYASLAAFHDICSGGRPLSPVRFHKELKDIGAERDFKAALKAKEPVHFLMVYEPEDMYPQADSEIRRMLHAARQDLEQ